MIRSRSIQLHVENFILYFITISKIIVYFRKKITQFKFKTPLLVSFYADFFVNKLPISKSLVYKMKVLFVDSF